MSDDHDHMLDPQYLDGLRARPLEEVRAMRAAAVEVETGLSYLRRMVQGPLDIVHREIARRSGGEGPADLATMVAELPETLGDVPRPGGVGRLTRTLEPTDVDAELEAELSALVGDLAEVAQMDDGPLERLAADLTTFEARVSARRQAFFALIDQIQAEIARRYQSGEASVDALLER